jgi:hypothetical protein
VLLGYLEKPGRYFLPSSFIPVWITKLLTNPFPLFHLLPNLKLPVLVLIWGLEQKKLESVFPHYPFFNCESPREQPNHSHPKFPWQYNFLLWIRSLWYPAIALEDFLIVRIR